MPRLEDVDLEPTVVSLAEGDARREKLRKVRPFLPMLIADGFTPEALRACRSRGIIATRPDRVFGQDVARALSDLLQTLSNAAAMAVGNPDKIENLFTRLSAIEGAATGHHARLGTRLPARLYRGRHLRRHRFMRFQGATRTDPGGRYSRTGLPPWVFDGEASLGPGLRDMRSGKPSILQHGRPLPRHRTFLAAPT
jgi:hypothetical protein